MKYKISLIIIFLSNILFAKTFNLANYNPDPKGKSNSTKAFQNVIFDIKKSRDESNVLIINPGIYQIGKQEFSSKTCISEAVETLNFKNINNLTINGNNATLIYPDGLYFGSFTKLKNKLVKFDELNSSSSTASNIGMMIAMYDCNNIEINNLNLNGNNLKYIYGGPWGDKGIQLYGYGYYIFGCKNFTLNNCQTNNFGLDGIYFSKSNSNGNCEHVYLNNSNFNFNNRQGASCTGIINSTFKNCQFNSTGSVFQTAPASGIDFENENGGSISNINITNCEFMKNTGMAVIAYNSFSNPVKNINEKVSFTNCNFLTASEFLIEVEYDYYHFTNCNFYGTILNGNRTTDITKSNTFNNCHFYDSYKNGRVNNYNFCMIYNYSGASKIVYKNCDFNLTGNESNTNFMQNTSYPIVQKQIFDTLNYNIFDNCFFKAIGSTLINYEYYATIIKGAIFKNKNSFIDNNRTVSNNRGGIYFDYCTFVKANLILNNNQVSYVFRLNTDIINSIIVVKKGSILDIQSDSFFMDSNSKIIVEEGAKLIIQKYVKLNIKGSLSFKNGSKFLNENLSKINKIYREGKVDIQ